MTKFLPVVVLCAAALTLSGCAFAVGAGAGFVAHDQLVDKNRPADPPPASPPPEDGELD